MKKQYYYFLLFLSFLTSSCVTVNTIHDGRTLGTDNAELAFVLNTGDTSRYVVNQLNEEGDPDFNLELDFTFGISEKFDMGFKANQSGTGALNGKYQWVGDKKSLFASSIGLEGGFNILELLIGDGLYYGAILNYNSIHLSDNICIFLNPKYVYSRHVRTEDWFSQPDNPRRIVNTDHSYLYSYGVIVGKTLRFGFEITNDGPLDQRPQQVGFSFSCVFGTKEMPK